MRTVIALIALGVIAACSGPTPTPTPVLSATASGTVGQVHHLNKAGCSPAVGDESCAHTYEIEISGDQKTVTIKGVGGMAAYNMAPHYHGGWYRTEVHTVIPSNDGVDFVFRGNVKFRRISIDSKGGVHGSVTYFGAHGNPTEPLIWDLYTDKRLVSP